MHCFHYNFTQSSVFFYKFEMFVHSNDSTAGDWWLYFPKDVRYFTEQLSRRSLVFFAGGRERWARLFDGDDSHCLVSINVVVVRRDRLVQGWVTVCGLRKPSRYVSSHSGQLSLVIPPWVGATSTSDSLEANRHTTQCSIPSDGVRSCHLEGSGERKSRSVVQGPGVQGREVQGPGVQGRSPGRASGKSWSSLQTLFTDFYCGNDQQLKISPNSLR